MASLNYLYTNLVMKYEVLTPEGKSQLKNITLSRVNGDLTPEQILDACIKLMRLTKHTLMDIERVRRETLHR